MTRLDRVGLPALLFCIALGCQPSFDVLWCGTTENCPEGFVCDVSANRCVRADAGVPLAGGVAGGGVAGGTSGGTAGGGDAGGAAAGGGGGGGIGVGGGGAGGSAGGGGGGMPGDCQRDVDCGQPSACNVPTCVPPGRCESRPVDAGVLCRPATGLCDVPESCDGTSTECPMDALTPRGRPCGADAGACEVQSTCDGLSPVCAPSALKDAGTVCRQLDVCLPPQVCTGASATCPPAPVDAGARCDDGNLCSAGQCQATGCSYLVLPTPVSVGLLYGSVDAGVTTVRLPRGPTFTTGQILMMTSTSVCPGGANPPAECVVDIDFRPSSFTTSSGTLFTGSGVVQLRAPFLRMNSTPPVFGQAFTWGASLGPSGCQGGMPVNAAPVPVSVTYQFRAGDPDGGLVSPVTLTDLRSAIANTLGFCLPPTGLSGTAENELRNEARTTLSNFLNTALQGALQASIRRQLCLRPFRGVCAFGAIDAEGLCVDGSGACYSAQHFRSAIPTTPACVP